MPTPYDYRQADRMSAVDYGANTILAAINNSIRPQPQAEVFAEYAARVNNAAALRSAQTLAVPTLRTSSASPLPALNRGLSSLRLADSAAPSSPRNPPPSPSGSVVTVGSDRSWTTGNSPDLFAAHPKFPVLSINRQTGNTHANTPPQRPKRGRDIDLPPISPQPVVLHSRFQVTEIVPICSRDAKRQRGE